MPTETIHRNILSESYQAAIIARGEWANCNGCAGAMGCGDCQLNSDCIGYGEYLALDRIVTDVRDELRSAQGFDN